MSAYTAKGFIAARGLNESNSFSIMVPVATTMANTDTMDVTLPDGFDKDVMATATFCCKVSGNTYIVTENANIAVTNHNFVTGVTRLTATGAVTAGCYLRITYAYLK